MRLTLLRLRPILALCLLSLAILSSAQLDVPSASPRPFVPNNRWALVIGVSNYSQAIGPLKYTAKEAKELSQSLISDLRFEPENVRLLADGGEAAQAPTSENILANLDSLLSDKRLDKANLFVFYFSGHGVGTKNGDFLLPADVQKDKIEEMGVPVSAVIQRIVNAGLKNVLFIADACRAGAKNDFGQDLTTLCHQANIAVILGCSPGLRSYEYPDFKQGAFTHFLLEGIKKPELRDISGALWASKLGADVQTRVHDYTEPDHGKFAQVPALWGEQTTLDVLLAAYPQPPISDEAISSFKSKAKLLSKADYATAMINYSLALYEKDRFDETVEILKTVDQLGELTPEARYTQAVALDTLGRTGEAERVFATFKDLPQGFYRSLGIATSSSRTLSNQERLDAAAFLFESSDSWEIKQVAYGVIDAWGSFEQKLHYAKLYAATKTDSLRRQKYAEGQLALVQGKWLDSVKAFDQAAASPGPSPTDYVIYLAKVAPVLASGDQDLLSKYLDEGQAYGANAGFAYVERAMIAKQKGDADARVANLRIALTKDLSPQLIFVAAKIAGPYIGLLTKEFKEAAAKHPYSWKARIVLYFAKKIDGEAGKDEDALAADRYMDDPLTFNVKFFDFMESFMSEAVELGRLKVDVYRSQLDFYFLTLKDQSDKFGLDADVWMQFVQYGMFNERNAQVNQVVRQRLDLNPDTTPRALKPMALLLAMNRGDRVAAEKLFTAPFEPMERTDPSWFYACYLVSLDQPKEAAKLIQSLGKPSPEIASRMEALKTYLLAASGKLAEAKTRIPSTSDDAVVDAFSGLTWALVGDWEKAEPLLAEQAGRRVWAYLYLQEYATHILDQRYRATSRTALAKDLAFTASISQPGNGLYNRYSFTTSPGIAQFAGTVIMPCGTIDDKNPNLTGQLTFTVTPKGEFGGKFQPIEGDAWILNGAVDDFGNLSGTASGNGQTYTLTAKIAPPQMYKTYPSFKSYGQVLQLIDSQGFRVVLLAKSG